MQNPGAAHSHGRREGSTFRKPYTPDIRRLYINAMRGIRFCNTAFISAQQSQAHGAMQGKNGHFMNIFRKSRHLIDHTQLKELKRTNQN
jgi:hypothetical protein